jgi:hypothetical protein
MTKHKLVVKKIKDVDKQDCNIGPIYLPIACIGKSIRTKVVNDQER